MTDAPRVYVRAWTLCCFHSLINISTQTLERALTASVDSCAEIKVRVPAQPIHRVQELCESRGGRPGLSVLTSLTVSVDVKQHWTMLRHWSQFVPNMSKDTRGHEALPHHHRQPILTEFGGRCRKASLECERKAAGHRIWSELHLMSGQPDCKAR